MEEKRKPRCHNCKFAGQQFKINKLTHLHCAEPIKYNQETFDKGEFCAWDTLRVFNNTCEYHEFKATAILPLVIKSVYCDCKYQIAKTYASKHCIRCERDVE